MKIRRFFSVLFILLIIVSIPLSVSASEIIVEDSVVAPNYVPCPVGPGACTRVLGHTEWVFDESTGQFTGMVVDFFYCGQCGDFIEKVVRYVV